MTVLVNKTVFIKAALGVASVLLIGCDGVNIDGADDTVLTGVLADGIIQGVAYSTETRSGITNAQGEFNFLAGEQITFSIGETKFPSMMAESELSIDNMAVGNADPVATTTNIVRLLESLDADANPENGIQIPDAAVATAAPITFNTSTDSFENNPAVLNMVANSGSINTKLVSSGSRLDEYRNTDVRNGGTLSQNNRWLGNITFTISSQSASRSEIRRNEQKFGSQQMGGKFTLVSEGSGADRLNIIQALTVEGFNATSGSAKPNEQLVIRKTGRIVDRLPEWEFILLQTPGQPTCTSTKFTRGERMTIRMDYAVNNRPVFTITKGGTRRSCVSGTSQVVGTNRSGESDRYFYGKLGVYATRSGQGPATVNWQSVYD